MPRGVPLDVPLVPLATEAVQHTPAVEGLAQLWDEGEGVEVVVRRPHRVVLCLRAGYVQRRDAKTCRDRLLQAEVKLLGVVLNRHQGVEGRYRSGYSGAYGGASYGTAEAYGAAGQPEAVSAASAASEARARGGKKGGVAAL